MLIAHLLYRGILFHIAQASEVVRDFPLKSRDRCLHFSPFFQGANLLQGQRIALNRRQALKVSH